MDIIMQTDRTVLRFFREEDYEFFCKLHTDPFVLKYELDRTPTQDELDNKFKDVIDLAKSEELKSYTFLVEKKDDQTPLGKVLIWQIDKAIDEWEMGWAFHSDYIGNGYAPEASKALIEFGFEKYGANRICANCNDANTNSERVMQKIGMTKEGVFRATRKLNGQWYGSCVYSILRSEFDNRSRV